MLLYVRWRFRIIGIPERVPRQQARVRYLADPKMEESSPASFIELNPMPEQEGQNSFEPRLGRRRVPMENFGHAGLARGMRRYGTFHINLSIHEPDVRAVRPEIDYLRIAIGIPSYMQAALLQEHGRLICDARLS